MSTEYAIRDTDLVLQAEDAFFNRKYLLKVRDLPPEEKPREKLLKYGPGNLALHELLAVLLSSGTTKEEVLAMSARILKDYGERTLLGRTNAEQMSKDLDIPIGKAMQIVACGELGRRFFKRKEYGIAVIRSAEDVFSNVRDMRTLAKEHLRGLYLNAHHEVIHDEMISIGTINSSIIHPREVFKPAIEYSAVAVVLVHNHPSGITAPSAADIEITKQLVAAGKIIGIHLIDHVIVSKESFISIDIEY